MQRRVFGQGLAQGAFNAYSWTARQAQTGALNAPPPHQVSMYGMGRPYVATPSLGQTTFEWYQRAKAAIKTYEDLLVRVARIANATERQNIMTWLGHVDDEGTPAYRYATVVGDLKEDVERYTPPNYGAYSVERRTNRIEKLEAFNQQFKTKVVDAEKTYGLLPAPAPLPQAPEPQDLTLPIIGGASAIALAILLTAIA